MPSPVVIIAAVDFSDVSSAVIEHALEESYPLRNCTLHAVTVLEEKPSRVTDSKLAAADRRLRMLLMESLPTFAPMQPSPERRLRVHVRSGDPSREILELCYEARADRLVIGRHSQRRRWPRMGGVPADLLGRVPCTMILVNTPDYELEEFEICPACALVREDSRGDVWFCAEHSTGRIPRLVGRAGSPSHTPGWGLW